MAHTTQIMRIHKWVPNKLYGFTHSESQDLQVFFHINNFNWGPYPDKAPPLVGERVQVTYFPEQGPEGKAPKALKVLRLDPPQARYGIVTDFNATKGFGFIRTPDGRSHYLHRSEMLEHTLPQAGVRVAFYEGYRRHRSRACYVRIVSEEH